MKLKSLELTGFKSFAKKTTFIFSAPITAVVGPNGSGKSNITEAIRWVLGERSLKSLRGRRGDDLIFNGANVGAKLNRAAATLIFDNRDRKFNADYDEVSLRRETYRDGATVYYLNGAPVHFRDVIEFLSSASLGLSSHFVISQGEVDRIINLNNKERRSFIEGALGLRFYQWKTELSERKLAETQKNMERVAALRQELTPHLRFLKKQVEKIEQAEKWREELRGLYLEYLRRESAYLQESQRVLEKERRGPGEELVQLQEKLSRAKERPVSKIQDELAQLESRGATVTRELGRLEGMIELKTEEQSDSPASFSFSEVKVFLAAVQEKLAALQNLPDLPLIKAALQALKEFVSGFLASRPGVAKDTRSPAGVPELLQKKIKLDKELKQLKEREEKMRASRDRFLREIEEEKSSAAREKELTAVLTSLVHQEEKLKAEKENFSRELNEGKLLVGEAILAYSSLPLADATVEPRSVQEERRRQIERRKIRLEDLGVESSEMLKEYEEISRREEFLSQELADLAKSAKSLEVVIKELKEKITHDFKDGLLQINRYFQEFFSLMFGGGSARLNFERMKGANLKELAREEGLAIDDAALVKEAAETEEGISIQVNLPRKKIKGLEMLSGGERALVSIALLFALSQVNPPPFLVLDETDAALDESNSRRYGEMVENLARHSQLILVTHNRETMAHAGILYGVTMGRDGASRLLSIRFDEAVAYAA